MNKIEEERREGGENIEEGKGGHVREWGGGRGREANSKKLTDRRTDRRTDITNEGRKEVDGKR